MKTMVYERKFNSDNIIWKHKMPQREIEQAEVSEDGKMQGIIFEIEVGWAAVFVFIYSPGWKARYVCAVVAPS